MGGRGHGEVRYPRSELFFTIVGISKAHRLLLTVLAPVGVLAGSYFVWRSIASSSPVQLLAKAYTEQRTLELRVGKARHSLIRMERGQQISPMNRPQSLLDAEAAIARGLRNTPGDSSLLTARGQANLLEWSYEAAITDMQEALGTQPKSPTVLNGLATAYFERAETEDRFDDYGTAFELQSRALQHSPDDALILFNRAITGAHLFLYKQSIEDWHHYLALDATGDWSDEAKQSLREVQGIVDAHDLRTKAPLLTPAEFVQTVDPTDSKTWDSVEPRIEEYLSLAITDWLPAAFPAEGKASASSDAKSACEVLAVILANEHADRWLVDLLSGGMSSWSARAFRVLSAAVRANADVQDYRTGLTRSAEAELLFSKVRSFPGEMRAAFEKVYALHFSDAPAQCLREIGKIFDRASSLSYTWLGIQLRLEQSVCLRMQGNLGEASRVTVAAYRQAQASRYPGLLLRAAGFWAADLGEIGQTPNAWRVSAEGLKEYWSNSTTRVPGYNLYIFMDELSEHNEPWFLETAIDQQALALLPLEQYPLWGAFENSRLAKMAARAGMEHLANESLLTANRLFARAPKTEITENVRFGSEIEVVELSHHDKLTEELNRLRSVSMEKLTNFYVASDYFRAIGSLERAAGEQQESEEAFEKAVALLQEQRKSLHSESDRATWNRQSVESYRALSAAKLEGGDSFGALATWEMYEGDTFPKFDALNLRYDTSDNDAQLRNLRVRIAEITDRLSHTRTLLGGSVALIYLTVRDRVFLWRYSQNGLQEQQLKPPSSYIRMLATRFAELCAAPTSSVDAVQAIGRQLYGALVAPIANDLAPGQPLIIEADEPLSLIPFQALVDNSGTYLADRHPIVYLPTLQYLTASNSALGPSLVAMDALLVASGAGDGEIGLRPLPDALLEVHDVATHFVNVRQLTEGQASLSNVMMELPHAKILHFAGHAGVVSGKHGLLLHSSTLSSPTTVLDADALRTISLSDLQMVVLSACSTENAFGSTMWAPESLGNAFLRQGVPHVIATRWNVDSSAGRMLMRAFYDAIVSGRSVSQSLADAQSRVRRIEPHPYYWAGFDALGNP
jgi:CHAT domain-containing protein